MLLFSQTKRRAYCQFGVRFDDGTLSNFFAVAECIKKCGSGHKFFVRFALGVGLLSDGTPHNSCVVLDVPVCSSSDQSLKSGERVEAEIVALAALDINSKSAVQRKTPFGNEKDANFARNWTSIASSFAYQLGCTHIILEDAANLRCADGNLQLLSQLTLLTCGKTLYEKYGFSPREPIDDVFRTISSFCVSSLGSELAERLRAEAKFDKLITIRECFEILRGSSHPRYHELAHLVFERCLDQKTFQTPAYGLVRDYDFLLTRESTGSLNCSIESVQQFDIKIAVMDHRLKGHLEKYNVDNLDVVVLS